MHRNHWGADLLQVRFSCICAFSSSLALPYKGVNYEPFLHLSIVLLSTTSQSRQTHAIELQVCETLTRFLKQIITPVCTLQQQQQEKQRSSLIASSWYPKRRCNLSLSSASCQQRFRSIDMSLLRDGLMSQLNNCLCYRAGCFWSSSTLRVFFCTVRLCPC